MSKIFRKTRQLLLSTGNTRAYLKYAIGEIALVVIGILIALGINNYNQERKLHKVRQDYYKQILVDLNVDRKSVNKTVRKIDASITNYNIYIETFKEPNLPVEVIVQNLLKIKNDNVYLKFPTATIASLISNGEIKLLDSKIANHLTSYNASKEILISVFETNQDSYFDIYKEVLMGGLDLGRRLHNQPELFKLVTDDKRSVDMHIKLDAYYYYKSLVENGVVKYLRELLQEIDDTIILIKNKIEH